MTDDYATRLARLDACAISDALDQLGLPPSVTGLGSHAARGRVSGSIITVKLAAGTPPEGTAPRHLCTTAIDMAAPGQVIVVEQRTGVECAGWGGILSNAARGRGISGVIVEGLARDIDEAADIGFPVYARGATARTARGRRRARNTTRANGSTRSSCPSRCSAVAMTAWAPRRGRCSWPSGSRVR